MAAVCAAEDSKKPCLTCAQCDKASRGIHPDISVISKPQDKNAIVIDQIREIRKTVIIVPNDAEKKVYIITDADKMNKEAQNAFLQMLEEPPSHVVFILSTEHPVALLPTVRSRCVERITLIGSQKTNAVISDDAAKAAYELFSAIEQGNTAIVSFMFRLEKMEKTTFLEFITQARAQAAAKLRASEHCDSIAKRKKLAQAERILEKARKMFDLNVGIGHLSGFICANLLESEN